MAYTIISHIQVYSIGRADYGRLGLGKPQANGEGGDNSDAKAPTLVPGLQGKKCVDISCGTCVSFAVTEDGQCFRYMIHTYSGFLIGSSI